MTTTLTTTSTEPIAHLFIDGVWRAGSDGRRR
jgi:hypothetical protein